MKKIFFIFIIAFILNFVWENLHSALYESYSGGGITGFVLLKASVADAFLIVGISLLFLHINYLKDKTWLIIIFGVILSVFIEWFALYTNWWQYGLNMPIIPILDVGVTPAVQLGLLSYLSYKIQEHISLSHSSSR